jgi:hypothetical protein
VSGHALCNAWVRSEQLQSESTVRHYYARRIGDRAFWAKLATGKLGMAAAMRSAASALAAWLLGSRSNPTDGPDLATRLGCALASRPRPTLIVLSENDQTAAEFKLAARRPGPLYDALQLSSVRRIDLAESDHTFSSERWRDRVAELTVSWIATSFPAASASDFA